MVIWYRTNSCRTCVLNRFVLRNIQAMNCKYRNINNIFKVLYNKVWFRSHGRRCQTFFHFEGRLKVSTRNNDFITKGEIIQLRKIHSNGSLDFDWWYLIFSHRAFDFWIISLSCLALLAQAFDLPSQVHLSYHGKGRRSVSWVTFTKTPVS